MIAIMITTTLCDAHLTVYCVKASSFKKGKKLYIDTWKLLPLARFLPEPPMAKKGGGKGKGKDPGSRAKYKFLDRGNAIEMTPRSRSDRGRTLSLKQTVASIEVKLSDDFQTKACGCDGLALRILKAPFTPTSSRFSLKTDRGLSRIREPVKKSEGSAREIRRAGPGRSPRPRRAAYALFRTKIPRLCGFDPIRVLF